MQLRITKSSRHAFWADILETCLQDPAARNGILGNGDRDLKRGNRTTSEESGASTEWGVSLLLNGNYEDERIPLDGPSIHVLSRYGDEDSEHGYNCNSSGSVIAMAGVAVFFFFSKRLPISPHVPPTLLMHWTIRNAL